MYGTASSKFHGKLGCYGRRGDVLFGFCMRVFHVGDCSSWSFKRPCAPRPSIQVTTTPPRPQHHLSNGQWNSKRVCKDEVTTCFALIGLVAWKCLLDSTLRKLHVHPKHGHGRNGTISRSFPLIALITVGVCFHITSGADPFLGKKRRSVLSHRTTKPLACAEQEEVLNILLGLLGTGGGVPGRLVPLLFTTSRHCFGTGFDDDDDDDDDDGIAEGGTAVKGNVFADGGFGTGFGDDDDDDDDAEVLEVTIGIAGADSDRLPVAAAAAGAVGGQLGDLGATTSRSNTHAHTAQCPGGKTSGNEMKL